MVGADLAFPSNSHVFEALANVFDTYLDNGTVTEAWLAHEPRREAVEQKFWELLRTRGIHVRRLRAEELPSDSPPDIWVLRLTKSDNNTDEEIERTTGPTGLPSTDIRTTTNSLNAAS